MNSAQGQDRSNYQPVSPWTGLDFGIVKATEGLSFHDQTFPQNWANLKGEGKMRGAYHFLHPDQDGAAQARYFAAYINANGGVVAGDMLFCDTETLNANVDAVTNAFNTEVRALFGGQVIIGTYTNHNVGQHLAVTASRWPVLWFAWPSATAPGASLIAPWHSWNLWQWGETNGIDADAYNGTALDMQAWITAQTGHVPPVPDPGPVPTPPHPVFPYGPADYLGQPSRDPHCHSGYYGGVDHTNVMTWQAQMKHRGWHITPDGYFGPASSLIARQFQQEKGLQVDGLVGPQTWNASWNAPVT